MAGNALGHPLHNERAYTLARLFPHGLHDLFTLDLSSPSQRLPTGHITGEFTCMLAQARALIASGGHADRRASVMALVQAYQPQERRYSPYTSLALDALSQGADPDTLALQVGAVSR
jgi:hypothetical protein